MELIKLLSAVLVGGIGGYLVPMFAQKLIDYKGKQKNKVYEEQPQYLSLFCKILCSIISAVGLGICAFFQAPWFLLIISVLIWILGMTVLIVDIRIRIIPNETVLAFLVLGIILRIGVAGIRGIPNSIITMIVISAVWIFLARFMGFGKVGAGDVKLCSVMGLMFGYPIIRGPILVMALSLVLFCLGGLGLRKLTRYTFFAMGPFLVMGMLSGFPYLFYMMR